MLSTCLREIAYICAISELEVKAQHITSESNRLADYLSRVNMNSVNLQYFLTEIDFPAHEVNVDDNMFEFISDW
mgnify:CR=1 FL=1